MTIDTSFDFGFSILDDSELKAAELAMLQDERSNVQSLLTDLDATKRELSATENEYYQKLEALRDMIMPLLVNLKKDPHKNYIFWPNRAEKLNAFISKINSFVDEA